MGTGVLRLLGGESGTGVYGVAQTRTRLLGRRTLNPQAAKQVRVCYPDCILPAKTCYAYVIVTYKFRYLNPLPVTRQN